MFSKILLVVDFTEASINRDSVCSSYFIFKSIVSW